MVLLSSISRFGQIGFVSGKWKQVAPTHATLLERKTSQQLFLEGWMLEKQLLLNIARTAARSVDSALALDKTMANKSQHNWHGFI